MATNSIVAVTVHMYLRIHDQPGEENFGTSPQNKSRGFGDIFLTSLATVSGSVETIAPTYIPRTPIRECSWKLTI